MVKQALAPAQARAQADRPSRRIGRRALIAGALALIAALFVLLSPWPLDAKMRAVGYACCAQAPTRTLRIGGSLMPLDARDAGLYLALLLGLVMAWAVGRGRGGRFPPRAVTALLAGLIVAMILDGFNSSFESRGLHALYHTTNPLRVLTGAAAGLAIALHGLPLVNRLVWREPEDDAAASGYGELAGYAIAAAILVALLLSPRAWLYYPLSLLATLGVLVGWGLANGIVVVVATRREHRAVTRVDGALVLLAGVVLSFGEMWAAGLVRALTTR